MIISVFTDVAWRTFLVIGLPFLFISILYLAAWVTGNLRDPIREIPPPPSLNKYRRTPTRRK